MTKLNLNTRIVFAVAIIIVFVLVGVIIINKGEQGAIEPTTNTSSATNPAQVSYKMRTIKPSLTVASIISDWKKYIDPQEQYSFEIPRDWKVTVNQEGSKLLSFTAHFSEEQKYYFAVFPPPGGGREIGADNIKSENIIAGGTQYEIRTFYKTGKAVVVEANPKDKKNSLLLNLVVINLPPTNAEKYITTFYHILSTFRFSK